MDEQKKMSIQTYDWEENMFDELSSQLSVSDQAVLTIATTVLVNEISSLVDDKKCMLLDILMATIGEDAGEQLIQRAVSRYLGGLDDEQLAKMAQNLV